MEYIYLENQSSQTKLLSPSLLHPVGILVVGVSLVTLALRDILNRTALSVDTIARSCIMESHNHHQMPPELIIVIR